MVSLEEWCFDFYVTWLEPIPWRLMDDLLSIEAIGWAEAHQFGIGGSYRPASSEVARAACDWHF